MDNTRFCLLYIGSYIASYITLYFLVAENFSARKASDTALAEIYNSTPAIIHGSSFQISANFWRIGRQIWGRREMKARKVRGASQCASVCLEGAGDMLRRSRRNVGIWGTNADNLTLLEA